MRAADPLALSGAGAQGCSLISTERLIVAKRRTTTRSTTAPAGRRRRFWNYPRANVGKVRRWLPSWRFILGTFLLGVGVVVGVGAMAYYTTEVPGQLPDAKQQTSTVYWSDGTTPMVDWYTDDRTIIEYSSLPQCDGQPQAPSAEPGVGQACIGNAVVASEDSTFWTNSGVDPRGMARALINNLRGGARQGGSTLTQQYVERYYEGTTTSYAGKAREAILALKIAKKDSKEVIIGNYLNTIYFGRGANGIEAAANNYFGIPAAQLNYSQAAFLSGIIPSPNRYDKEDGVAWAQKRWQRSINRMAEAGYITPEQKAAAVFPAEGTEGGLIAKKADDRMAGTDGYLIQMVRDELISQGYTDAKLDGDGLKIVTTFDKPMQDAAVATMLSVYDQDPKPSPYLGGALVSIDPATGSVRALYGGKNYLPQEGDPNTGQFNNATQGKPQPGSTFKPFTLIAALEQGHSLNETFDGKSGLKLPGWDKPLGNFSGQSFGQIDLVKATAFSVNTVYAALNAEVGPESTAWAAYQAGIGRHTKPNLTEDDISSVIETNQANVLGTSPVRPVDLATAYATIAARGTYTPWHVVDQVIDSDGAVVFRAADAYQPVPGAITADAADGATYAMQHVVTTKGASGNPARKLDRPVAGKTGTTQENKSAWFAGFTPQLVTVVGLFQSPDDGSQGNVPITAFGKWAKKEITGGSWPVEAWTSYMTTALQGQPVQEFPKYTPKKPLPTETPSAEPTETVAPSPEPTPEPTPEPEPTPDYVPVPAVGGQGRDAAFSALKAAGFNVSEQRDYSDTVPAGNVISTLPAAGNAAPRGSSIVVIVSEGPKPQPPGPNPAPNKPAGGG